MKQIVSLLSALILCLTVLPLSVFAKTDPIYDMTLDSQGVYIVNLETGTSIYEKAADHRMFPASVTKVMTALVVLDKCENPRETIVTCPEHSMFNYIIYDRGVHTELRMGEQISAYDLLMALMLESYCDVAELLAYHFGGNSVENFVQMMNDKVEELGLKNTHFENAHGLHSANHYSSPRDLAVILQKAIENPIFREIIETREYTIPATSRHAARPLDYTVGIYYEQNSLYCDAFVGGKSGFTDQAGRCLATYSSKDGMSFISVLLGANMDSNRLYPGNINMSYAETSTLIRYAYDHYEIRTVIEKGQELSQIPVTGSDFAVSAVAGEEVRILARRDQTIEHSLSIPQEIRADEVINGAAAGTLSLTNDGEVLDAVWPVVLQHDGTPIVTKSPIEEGAVNAVGAIRSIFQNDSFFVTLVILLLLVIALSVPALKITQYLHRRKLHRPKH